MGEIIIGDFRNKICLFDWRYRKMRQQIDKRIQGVLKADYLEGKSDLIEEAKKQSSQYFEGNRQAFELPLLMVGSDFQKSVWEALMKIPFGETETYQGLSKTLNKEKAIRAVASANGANAISIMIPCHRIIGSDGKLVGYAGGLHIKKKLLELEGSLNNTQLSLF